MAKNEVNTEEPLSSEVDVASEDGGAAASGQSLKDVLSKELGKNFLDDATALKAVKDTFSYVGATGSYRKAVKTLGEKLGLDESGVLKRLEETARNPEALAPRPELASEVQELKVRLEDSEFYGERPELKPYKDLLADLRGGSGKLLKDIAESDVFKNIIEKAQAHDEAEKSKSVLESNPRIGHAKDAMNEAREALKNGKVRIAHEAAVKSVLASLQE